MMISVPTSVSARAPIRIMDGSMIRLSVPGRMAGGAFTITRGVSPGAIPPKAATPAPPPAPAAVTSIPSRITVPPSAGISRGDRSRGIPTSTGPRAGVLRSALVRLEMTEGQTLFFFLVVACMSGWVMEYESEMENGMEKESDIQQSRTHPASGPSRLAVSEARSSCSLRWKTFRPSSVPEVVWRAHPNPTMISLSLESRGSSEGRQGRM